MGALILVILTILILGFLALETGVEELEFPPINLPSTPVNSATQKIAEHPGPTIEVECEILSHPSPRAKMANIR